MAATNSIVYKEDNESYSGDELNSNWSFVTSRVIVNTLNTELNSALDHYPPNYGSRPRDGWDTTTTNYSNIVIMYDNTETFANCEFHAATVFDNFDSAALDTNKWTETGTGTYTQYKSWTVGTSNNDKIISDGASGLDMKGQDGEVVVGLYSSSGAGTTPNFNGYISNGTNRVKFIEDNSGTLTSGVYKIVFNNAAETVDVYRNGTLVHNDLDISSVTSNWYLEFIREFASDGTGKVFSSGYIKNGQGASTGDITTPNKTTGDYDASIAYCITTENTSNAVTIQSSGDNGSSYMTAVQNGVIQEMTSTATGFKLKISVVIPTSIDTDSINISRIREYGGFYG